MLELIRRHRAIAGGFLFVFIGFPMLFFGLPNIFGGPSQFEDATIITVDDVPVTESAFRQNLSRMAQARAGAGERPTFQELDEDGTVADVVDQMVRAALLERERNQLDFSFNEDFLAEQLRKDALFQNDEGQFDPEEWNEWVRTMETRGVDWNSIYEDLSESMAHQTFLSLVQASGGRSTPTELESELDYQLQDEHTKLKIRHVQIKPPIEPDVTEEEMLAHYDKNLEDYRALDQKTAKYVRIPLAPPLPEKAAEIMERAKAGEDFAALANEFSDLQTQDGGSMGWRRQTDTEPEHRQPIWELAVGEVSDPIEGPNGFYIFKVEEERFVDGDPPAPEEIDNENAPPPEPEQVREVNARQIFLNAPLDDEGKAALVAEAKALADQAAELDSLDEAAAAAGLTVETSPQFTDETVDIESIPRGDVFEFRNAFTDEEIAPFNVITGQENVYVAVLAEKIEGEVPAFEEVSEEIRTLLEEEEIAKTAASDLYHDLIDDYAEKIESELTSIDQIAERFPELEGEIKETDYFKRGDFLFQEQFYVQPRQIHDELARAPFSTMAGPFEDFRGDTFFVQLEDRLEPSEEDLAAWEEEVDSRRDRTITAWKLETLEDYAQHLNENVLPNLPIQYNTEVIDAVLGRDEYDIDLDGDTPEENPNALDEAAEAPAEETASEEASGDDGTPAE